MSDNVIARALEKMERAFGKKADSSISDIARLVPDEQDDTEHTPETIKEAGEV